MKIVEDKGVINKEAYALLDQEERFNYWQISQDSYKLISELDQEHLQNAFYFAQTKELLYFNKHNLFNELAARIEEEGTKRKIVLNDINTKFHKNKRKYSVKV